MTLKCLPPSYEMKRGEPTCQTDLEVSSELQIQHLKGTMSYDSKPCPCEVFMRYIIFPEK